ncbi:MAG: Carbohydrate-selective porin OprB [Caulobacter sp.]|nr:Carbohydrate-selective porin OprB [Caulobacter sp.]
MAIVNDNPKRGFATSSLATAFAAAFTALALTAGVAKADDDKAVTFSAVYTADVIGPVQGGAAHAGRFLDNTDLIADVDLEKLIGWKGATLHGYLLNNSGGIPNDVAGTLQGVDNIEVAMPRAKLYELWLQQSVDGDRGSVLVGLYNLNSEFYANESAGLLLAPPFGIGSELAATGPNGPSIFPSTSLAVRLAWKAKSGAYARAAILNAHAGVPGDPGGTRFTLDDGALVIGEAGIEGDSHLAIGAWRYTRKQDDILDVDIHGDPLKQTAQGVYVLGEHRLAGDPSGDGPQWKGFFRIGFSDAKTSPFSGGWQAGVQRAPAFASRPDSAFSIGVDQAWLSSRQRDLTALGGDTPSRDETGLEITYSDKIMPHVTVQPDFQVIGHPGGLKDARTAVVLGLRVKIDLNP